MYVHVYVHVYLLQYSSTGSMLPIQYNSEVHVCVLEYVHVHVLEYVHVYR